MKKKIILVIGGLFWLVGAYCHTPRRVYAQDLSQVIFVNQVRGDECCNPGSLDNFKFQIENFQKHNLPAFFALRYDALIDPDYQAELSKLKNNNLFKFGILLEITPRLAQDTGVDYQAGENWFEAQHAFLVGYSPEDRVKLVKQVIQVYQNIFDQNPEFGSAWVIDTPTLNFLYSNYNLKFHQITREQWGLDSYSLSGGPRHYPYIANQNWLFVPNKQAAGPLIIRQTLADPLYNYGDQSSAFTSQPNDYSLDGKDFAYFKDLLNQALFAQEQTGFACLGLENSMAINFQQEYAEQIAYVAKLKQEQKIILPQIKNLINFWSEQKINLFYGQDLISQNGQHAYWVTTPYYQLRLRFKNKQVFISDLRVYDQDFTDPYSQAQAIAGAYLVMPFILNSAISLPDLPESSWQQKLLNIPALWPHKIIAKSDLNQADNILILPEIDNLTNLKIIKNLNQIIFKYQNNNLIFNLDNFEVNNLEQVEINQNNFKNWPVKLNQHNLAWQINNQDLISLDWLCEVKTCKFSFKSQPELLTQAREKQYIFLLPEDKPREIAAEKTIIYSHNQYAIADRNPVRIIIASYDEAGFSTAPLNKPEIITQPELKSIKFSTSPESNAISYLDLDNDKAGKFEVKINLANYQKNLNIYFAPNCKQKKLYCLTHPVGSWRYVKTLILDKFRAKLLNEKQ